MAKLLKRSHRRFFLMIKALAALTSAARKDKEVLAVVLFGSFAREEKKPSDVDVCLVLARKQKPIEMSKIRLKYLSGFPSLDIQIFQQLPLYVRTRVFGEGRVVFCKNIDLLYDVAANTAREFEDYKHIYEGYLEEVLHAR